MSYLQAAVNGRNGKTVKVRSYIYSIKSRPCDHSVPYSSVPGRPVPLNTDSTSLGSIQPCCNYCTKTIHSFINLYPPLPGARLYSLVD